MNHVYVYETSPQTLDRIINKVLATPDFQRFDSDQTTYIKINANYDREWPGCNTSKWFLNSLFKCLKDHSFNDVIVIEGDLKLQPAERTIRVTGVNKLLDKYNIPFLSIEDLPRENEIPKILNNSQLISTPVLHTHTFAVISVATKNLYGLLPVYREKYHHMLSEKLLELSKNVKVFSIVDGTVGLEGGSMRTGTPLKTDLIIAGWNPVNIDIIAAKTMGFSIDDVPYLKLAKKKEIIEEFQLSGDFSQESLPNYKFFYEESSLSSLDLWIRRNFKFLFRYGSFFDRSFNKMRRKYTASVYEKKVKTVMNGEWNEYSVIYNEDTDNSRY